MSENTKKPPAPAEIKLPPPTQATVVAMESFNGQSSKLAMDSKSPSTPVTKQ